MMGLGYVVLFVGGALGVMMGMNVKRNVALFDQPGQAAGNLTVADFGTDLAFLDPDLVQRLLVFDRCVYMEGSRVMLSPVAGALFRKGEGASQHYFGRAADVMIKGPMSLQQAFEIAVDVGFTGIGVYPHWKPYHGLHLDIRPDRAPGLPAKWAGLKINGIQSTEYTIERGFYEDSILA